MYEPNTLSRLENMREAVTTRDVVTCRLRNEAKKKKKKNNSVKTSDKLCLQGPP